MKLSRELRPSEDGNASLVRLPSLLSQISHVVRPIGAPNPSQTLPAPAARLSFSADLYRASILVNPQQSQDEGQGQGVVCIEGLGAARSRPQAPHRRRRFVATARLSRLLSRASLAHRGEVSGPVAPDMRGFMRMWRRHPRLPCAWGLYVAWFGMIWP